METTAGFVATTAGLVATTAGLVATTAGLVATTAGLVGVVFTVGAGVGAAIATVGEIRLIRD
jgi:hypothetical protein